MKYNALIRHIVDYSVYLVVRVVICIVQSLSAETCRAGADFLAFIFTNVIRVRHRLLAVNLSHAFPDMTYSERRELIHRIWNHLFLLAAEVAIAPRLINELNWYRHVRLIDYENTFRCMYADRPTIIVTGHFGNFELGGYILGLLGYPTFSVARTLDNPWLNRFIQDFRESTGQFLISKNDGYDEILEVLKDKGTIAFLADQSAGPKGCWIRFFGRRASAYKAMALLSIEYDAPILVCCATRRDDTPLMFDMRTLGMFDPRNRPDDLHSIAQITQWFSSELERCIRQFPEQYWWIHNRWKTYGKTFRD